MANQKHKRFSHSNVSSAISDDGDFDNFGTVSYPAYEVSYSDRGRRPKFSAQELEALVSGIEMNKDIVLPPTGMASYQGSLGSSAARQNSWKEIVAKVNAVSEVKRSLPEVVKRWRYLKSRTRVKARRLTKWDKPLSELQKRILDTVGDIETTSNGDKDSNELYDEDCWDEVYDVDVANVDEEHNEDDSAVIYEHQTEQTSNPEACPENPNIPSPSVTSKGSSSRIIPPSTASHNTQQTGQHTYAQGERHRLADGPAAQYARSGIGLRRTPTTSQIHTGTSQEYDSFRAASLTERFPDKNNVNITVQSCSCRHDNPKKSIEEERLEIEKERLSVEKERLAVERQRLELERERLQIVKMESETNAS